jgi:hypothetical protein
MRGQDGSCGGRLMVMVGTVEVRRDETLRGDVKMVVVVDD